MPEPLYFTFDRAAVSALLQHTLDARDRAPIPDLSYKYEQSEGAVPAGLWLVIEEDITGDIVSLASNGREYNERNRPAHPFAYALETDTEPLHQRSDYLGRGCLFIGAADVQQWLHDTFAPLTCALLRESPHDLYLELVRDLHPSELAEYARGP